MNKWDKEYLCKIISESKNKREVFSKLGIRAAGGNWKTLYKYINLYAIDISHFKENYSSEKIELKNILVEGSNYNRTNLKKRLYEEGLLNPICCLCGQDENWNGMKISLILDHINGIHNDNRIENLRIVCPNCNAGLDTFAGKNRKIVKIRKEYKCNCGKLIFKNSKTCNKCRAIINRKIVNRPPIEILLKDIEELGYSGTGRKYGVSDNAIRKWIKIEV